MKSPGWETEIRSIFLAHVAQIFEGDYCLRFLDGAGWRVAEP
jgi:hypothetical protein